MIVNLTYQQLLNIRKNSEITDGVGPVLYFLPSGDDYILSMSHKNDTLKCVATGDDATDFETNRLAFSNKIILPLPDQVNSHNFCDADDWVETPSSLYCFGPTAGKRARLKQINGVLDSGIDLGPSKFLQMTSWFSIDGTVCPTFVPGTPTDFGTPLFDPYQNVNCGWYCQPSNSKQDYKTWVWLEYGVPTHGLRHYVWDSITKLKLRAQNFTKTSAEINLFYSFFNTNDFFEMRSSLKERLEVWIEGNTALATPNSIGAFFAVHFSLYDEW